MEGLVPDFSRIDRLVKEYVDYRQVNPISGNVASPDDILEKIMKCFDTGDYPNILYLWDSHVSQKLNGAEAHLVHEANVAEFYMHIHCATCPFRQSFIREMSNPSAAGKIAARSMTIFKHYVETKGKGLASTPEFHQFKHLPKIAFPPTHPKYQHLFYEEWITRTRESYFKFLIPFLKEHEYPALCYELSSRDKSENPLKTPDVAVQKLKEKERRTAKIAKALLDAAADFVDSIGEDCTTNKASIDEMQEQIKEFGKALLPHSSGGLIARSSEEESLVSIFTEVDTIGIKKKRKVKKKKPNYDFNLIGVDLSSMINELSAELKKHLQEGVAAGTSSLSVDLEMATQSALQGCLLIKALRNMVSTEATKSDLSPTGDGMPENEQQDAPSPRSKGGAVDRVVSCMTQGDLLGVTSTAETDDGDVVNQTALPFESLLSAYSAACCYIRDLPVVEEPGQEKAVISREDQMLIDTLTVSRYFVEDYISLVAMVCTSVSGVTYITSNSPGVELYSKIIQFLLDLKPSKSDMMVKLHVVCLCSIITIGRKVPECLEHFVHKGGIPWLAATLGGLFGLDDEVAKSLPEHENYVDLCMGLLHLVVRAPSCRQLLFASPEILASTESIAALLLVSILLQTNKAIEGKKASRPSSTPPQDILFYLLENHGLKSALQGSAEVAKLKILASEIEGNESMAAKLGTIKSLLKTIDSLENSASSVEASVSDLVYSVGVNNLVYDMLVVLKESDEVLRYREENQSYSTNDHILEKYKQVN